MMNLFRLFKHTAERQPAHPAIVDCEKRQSVSYGQLLRDVGQFAEQLRRAGVRPGHCVGLHVPSGRRYIVATYAIWECGACVVPIPMELSLREKQAIPSNIALDAMLSTASTVEFWSVWQRGAPATLGQLALVPLTPAVVRPAGFAEINGSFIRFSSGTTGDAKGVVLSHDTIYDRIHAANDALHIGPNDRVAWLLSMSYHFAASIVAYLSFGATIVLPGRNLNFGGAIVEAVGQHKATLIYGSPQQYQLMAADRGDSKFDSVRVAISTTTSLPREIADAFDYRFGLPLTQVYGLIEVGLPCMNLNRAREHFDSVGQVLPAYELRMDGDFGEGLKEIHFRGRGFLDAYYNPWQTRDEITPDGWFHTGDLGELNANGCLFIRGRSKEMINVGGMKVFPREVEAVLHLHPAVQEAAVFAVRRMRSRESLCANVVVRPEAAPPEESELRQFCAKQLAHYKVPQRIHFVPQLARTASGKILRRAVEPA